MNDFAWQFVEPLHRALTDIAKHYMTDEESHCAICRLTAEVALAGDWPYNVTHTNEPTA